MTDVVGPTRDARVFYRDIKPYDVPARLDDVQGAGQRADDVTDQRPLGSVVRRRPGGSARPRPSREGLAGVNAARPSSGAVGEPFP